MTVSRRRFLERSAAATTAAAAASLAPLPTAAATPPPPLGAAATPAWPVIALCRMGYGPRAGDVAALESMGFAAYIEQQLSPDTIDDSACDARIAAARLRITYPAYDDGLGTSYPAVDEARPLSTLALDTPALWPRAD